MAQNEIKEAITWFEGQDLSRKTPIAKIKYKTALAALKTIKWLDLENNDGYYYVDTIRNKFNSFKGA